MSSLRASVEQVRGVLQSVSESDFSLFHSCVTALLEQRANALRDHRVEDARQAMRAVRETLRSKVSLGGAPSEKLHFLGLGEVLWCCCISLSCDNEGSLVCFSCADGILCVHHYHDAIVVEKPSWRWKHAAESLLCTFVSWIVCIMNNYA